MKSAIIRLVFPLAASLFILCVAFAQSPQTVKKPPVHHSSATLEGDWAGSLEAGDAVLHLVLHVSKAADGGFKATIDSLDQGVYGIEVTAIALKDSNLKLSVASVGASYDGKVSATFSGIEGVWSQGSVGLPLAFHRRAAGAGAKEPSDAIASSEGVWQAAFAANGLRLRLQLHVSHDDEKQLVAALDSPDQGINGLPATKVSQKESVFHFEIPVVEGVYEGTINAAKNAIAGTWTQHGVEQKLEFKRSDKVLEVVRPQNPVKPYPYHEEDLTFPNDKSKITLAGTLTIPSGTGPFPAAVLISGSGPHDRDENILGHRPFLVLADHLTRNGIAVLRFDKRGIGKSTGNYDQATGDDFASDVEAAVAFLKSRKEINPAKIGLIGHSEGGIIAPLVATRSNSVAWVVLLAGPGLKGEQLLLLQAEAILRASGVNEGEIFRTLAFNKQSYALVRQESDPVALQAKLNDLVQSTSTGAAMSPSALQAQIHLMVSPWFRSFLDYDPVPTLQKTSCPVLALNGERDLQVPPKENLSKIKKALEDGGNKDFQTTEMPGLNHLFQHAPTGSPIEYGAIEETFAPEALSSISDWIGKHTVP
ncbi:MAG TPA: alpha/beta hydrolase [Candidatus Acidoferrum sp.]|nr:alpha/beta hydrolase [Candidatus Acidoferrum sp.]